MKNKDLYSTIFRLLPPAFTSPAILSQIYILLYLDYYFTLNKVNDGYNAIYILLYLDYYLFIFLLQKNIKIFIFYYI